MFYGFRFSCTLRTGYLLLEAHVPLVEDILLFDE
jgi:hypothetical protein